MSYIPRLSLVDTSRINISNGSLKRLSFEKGGVIELNKIKITIEKNDRLQSLVNKINNKTSLHKIKARLGKERGQDMIYLAATKEVKITDVKGILNNVPISIIVKPESNYGIHNLLNEEFYLFLATRWDTNNLPSKHSMIPNYEAPLILNNNAIVSLNNSIDSLIQDSKSEVESSVSGKVYSNCCHPFSNDIEENPTTLIVLDSSEPEVVFAVEEQSENFARSMPQFEPLEESNQAVTIALHRQDEVNNRVRTRAYSLEYFDLPEYEAWFQEASAMFKN